MSDSSLDDGALGAGPEGPTGSTEAEPTQDLGFGSVVSRESRARFR